jgi:hypothetical protein
VYLFTGIVVIIHYIALSLAWSAYKSETRSAFRQFDIEKAEGYKKAVSKIKSSSSSKIYNFLAFPIAKSSVNHNGGKMPLWGMLAQSLIWGMAVFFIISGIFKRKSE